MRVLITGANGLLGQKLAAVFFQESMHTLLLTDKMDASFDSDNRLALQYLQLDITDKNEVKRVMKDFRPDAVINTAALTNVDACESEREFAWKLNVDGVKHLLIGARALENCHVIQISTDYVFDGKSDIYEESSRPNPLSYYGKTKLAAENAMIGSSVKGTVVRTQVLYGTGVGIRPNFVLWVLDKLHARIPFHVVTDQFGNPTYVEDLAFAILKIVEKQQTGLYHVCGPEIIDRHSFARKIAEEFKFDPKVILPITSKELNQPANRPMNSSFATLKFETEFLYRLSDVRQGLRRMLFQYYGSALPERFAEDKPF
jgi:dTDP-4-dehydrorhamnose reductase